MKSRAAWWALAAVLALGLGGLSRWQIFEYDLFWQVRAGREIVATGAVQRVDGWSFTAAGQPWVNFQWLATVADYLVFRAGGGYGALGWLRAGLCAAWVLALATLVWRSLGAARTRTAWLVAPLLCPWVYLASSFRLQMRPDLYAIGLFAGLVVVWLSGLALLGKRVASLAALVVWTNCHAGTCPFGIVFVGAAILFAGGRPAPEKLAAKALWIAAALATWFATPVGDSVLAIARLQVGSGYAQTGNPDFRPFDLSLLDFANGGYGFVLWTAYTALAVACTVRLVRRRHLLPGIYSDVRFVLLVGAGLTALSLQYIRALPYQMVFLLPVVAAGVGSFLTEGASVRRLPAALCVGAIALIGGVVLPDHVDDVAKPLGSGVDDVEIPVQSVAFLARVHPATNLLNAYPFGGYLVGELPEMPVAIDGRDFPFRPFRKELDAARSSPAAYAEFLRRWNINAAIETVPSMTYDRQEGVFSDSHRLLYPTAEWAEVFFDNVSVVYLRRIPAHATVISAHEYRALRRGLPANFGAELQGLVAEDRAIFAAEIERCLAENPRCVYCLVGRAAFAHAAGDDGAAVVLLERALAIDAHSAEAWLELAAVYDRLGRSHDAARARARFDGMTRPPS